MTQLALFEVPTDKQRAAIAILQAHAGLEPLAFAKLAWPKSKGWAARGRFAWSMERVALGTLGRLKAEGYAFEMKGKWYAAVNLARLTLEPSPAEESTPF